MKSISISKFYSQRSSAYLVSPAKFCPLREKEYREKLKLFSK